MCMCACVKDYVNTINLFQINFENVATRLRESPFPMISVKEAVKMIRNSVQKEKEVEIINANDAYGRILWENVYSNCDLPPFRASIKDGYAVLASDGKGIRRVFCGVKAGNTVSFKNKCLLQQARATRKNFFSPNY